MTLKKAFLLLSSMLLTGCMMAPAHQDPRWTDDALAAIAKRAIERKTGARGLRSIMEDILLDTMFDLPGLDSVTKVVVNEEAAQSEAAPLMIHADAEKEPASAG